LISQALIRWKCDLVDASYGLEYQTYSSFSGSVGDATMSPVKRTLHLA
jgi:hypothetical protein